MGVLDAIAKGEGKTLELKESLPKNEAIAKTVVAFSNSGGGKLIIGVKDSLEIVGVDEGRIFELQDKIASIIFDSCAPNILPEIYAQNVNDKLLLVVEVFKGAHLPYYIKSEGSRDGVYIRLGATNRKADTERIAELERQRRHIGFDEEIDYSASFESLDISLLARRFKAANKELDSNKLQNLKLLKEENGKIYPTNALLILLGSPAHCMVKCARFKGDTTELFIDQKEYGGDIFNILESVQVFILNHINLRGEIRGLYRENSYEIPIEALREALVNALIHRDYANGGRDVKVGVYDNFVKILSPGAFPSGITADDILSGRSEARNKIVANAFKELGLVEQWGSGVARIKSACLRAGLKEPTIAEKNDFVEVVFWRNQDSSPDEAPDSAEIAPDSTEIAPDSAEIAPDKIDKASDGAEFLSPQQQKILDYLQTSQAIFSKDVERLLNIKDRRAREILSDMAKKRLIVKYGTSKNVYYRIEDKTNE